MNDKKYFEVFTQNQNDKYKLYNEVKEFIVGEIIEAKGSENAKFYDVLMELMNSENNAGWEGRHSKRIGLIRKTAGDIQEDYEEYLP